MIILFPAFEQEMAFLKNVDILCDVLLFIIPTLLIS